AFPDGTRNALVETVQVRNFVAHHYFEARCILATDENAEPHLIAELRWFSDLFEAWVPSLDKWADALLTALGVGEDELKSGREAFEERLPDLRRDQLNALRDSLERIGVEVPPLPVPAARQPDPADVPRTRGAR